MLLPLSVSSRIAQGLQLGIIKQLRINLTGISDPNSAKMRRWLAAVLRDEPFPEPPRGEYQPEDHFRKHFNRVIGVYKPGDQLWIREAFRLPFSLDTCHIRSPDPSIPHVSRIWYEADGTPPPWAGRPRSPATMPKWCSRMTVTVQDNYLQRMQDTSFDDMTSEGYIRKEDFKAAFRDWDRNPWCLVLRIRTDIKATAPRQRS